MFGSPVRHAGERKRRRIRSDLAKGYCSHRVSGVRDNGNWIIAAQLDMSDAQSSESQESGGLYA
jgi:hypothetical protein